MGVRCNESWTDCVGTLDKQWAGIYCTSMLISWVSHSYQCPLIEPVKVHRFPLIYECHHISGLCLHPVVAHLCVSLALAMPSHCFQVGHLYTLSDCTHWHYITGPICINSWHIAWGLDSLTEFIKSFAHTDAPKQKIGSPYFSRYCCHSWKNSQ